MKLNGIDRIEKILRQQILNNLWELSAYPITLEDCERAQNCLDSASIGQLYTLAHLQERTKGLKLFSVDKEGTIYIEISGLYGGMDLDGFIHT